MNKQNLNNLILNFVFPTHGNKICTVYILSVSKALVKNNNNSFKHNTHTEVLFGIIKELSYLMPDNNS